MATRFLTSRIDQLLDNARAYAHTLGTSELPMLPRLGVAVVAWMDARVNVYGILGLTEDDAHVIRNAGGAVIEDVLRSLAISQRLLGTSEIVLIHHSVCGMRTFRDDEFRANIPHATHVRGFVYHEHAGELTEAT